jgi:hypothetical protein
MTVKTYSFLEHIITFTHPAVGVYTVTGTGIGSVTVTPDGPITDISRAADGKVIMSKLKIPNGSISIQMQQTSEFHKFLKNYRNAIDILPASNYNLAVINISDLFLTREIVNAFSVAPEKGADITYEAQSGMVTWNFFCGLLTIL